MKAAELVEQLLRVKTVREARRSADERLPKLRSVAKSISATVSFAGDGTYVVSKKYYGVTVDQAESAFDSEVASIMCELEAAGVALDLDYGRAEAVPWSDDEDELLAQVQLVDDKQMRAAARVKTAW